MVGSLDYNYKKGCPPGFHKRSSYTSKKGYYVPPKCVKNDGIYRQPRKNYTQRILERQRSRNEKINKSNTRKKECPPGKVLRHGYVRRFGNTVMRKGYTVKRAKGKQYHIFPEKKTVFVKPACIKGNPEVKVPGTGQEIGILKKGELKKHGYVFLKHREKRHEALRSAIKEFGALGVYHKLDAITKLSKNKNPEASKVFGDDREWVKRHFNL